VIYINYRTLFVGHNINYLSPSIRASYLAPIRRFKSKLIIDNTMPKSTATQNPLTWKPLITNEAKKMINPFITKVNSPKVKTLIGRVIRIRKGFRSKLTIPKE
jgi:hypothetical protein